MSIVTYGTLTFLGRGSIGLIQGIMGLLFSIQGYYGVIEYDLDDIRNFILWILVSSGGCIAIGITSLEREESYCRDLDAKEDKRCRDQVIWWV